MTMLYVLYECRVVTFKRGVYVGYWSVALNMGGSGNENQDAM